MELVPAILVKTRKEFIEKIRLVAPYVKRVQFDIMDGKFVSNKTWGTATEIIRERKKLDVSISYEVHLMVSRPEILIKTFVKDSAERIYFHTESTNEPQKVLDLITQGNKQFNKRCKKGIAINPETSVARIEPFLSFFDAILVMGVNPGFSGQKFQKIVLGKIKKLKKLNPKIEIGVDGGVSLKNAKEILSAGADYLVTASAIFGSKDIKKTIEKFKSIEAE